jgi:hypothetical protein
MNNKYVMINGFAFSEESDMEKLKSYAKEGWILEDIVAGFFYKLKKDKPKDMEYSLDYQSEVTEEYFNLFLEAGWTRVVSLGGKIHIFSAPVGTKPIYSDRESEIDKYASMKKQVSKGTIYSSIAIVILAVLLVVSVISIRPIFLVVVSLFIASIFVFIFNFMPYLAYNSRLKQLSKNGKCNSKIISNKGLWKLYAFAGIVFLFLGIIDLIEKKHFAICFILLGMCNIAFSLDNYKKEKN